ncbi:Mog1p/PsbP-like protein [Amylocystis lapponica]|nr:Mog1p/PsbP-like protein [Amylocystis lapponica]
MSTKELFGGTITVTLPANLVDAADLRQVPDTQEVFMYPDSGISVIVEVLESVEAQDAQGIAKLHFESIAHDNDAEESELFEVAQLPAEGSHQTPAPIVFYGTQTARKFNSMTPDHVRFLVAVYRVPQHNVDLVLTMNVPIKTANEAVAEADQSIATNVIVKALDAGAVSEDEWESAKKTFDVAVRSLRIVDLGLFA